MADYEFVLKFLAREGALSSFDVVERLGEAGCTDATVGTGVAGVVALDFARNAASAEDAMASAIVDVRTALPGALLLEASPDLVGLSDVADRVGVARQSIRKLWIGNDDFPAPIYSGSVSLWHLDDVLRWLKGRAGYDPIPSVMDIAAVARAVNYARERQRHLPSERIDRLLS